jgi:RimJ/RimL family protein N-acetyltransferase
MAAAPNSVEPMRFTADSASRHRLADGTEIVLRLLRPEHREQLIAGFDRLSPESRYRRFFTAMPELPEQVVRRLLDTDGWNHLAIVAHTLAGQPDGAEGVGIARFVRLKDDPEVAEVAVTVVDHLQRRGLGTLLVRAISAAARERGVRRVRAEVLRDNEAVRALLRDFDEDVRPVIDGTVAVYDLAIPDPVAEAPSGPLYRLLRLAAEGVEVVLRRLGHAPPERGEA